MKPNPDLIAIATIQGKRLTTRHEWARFQAGSSHLYVATKDPQVDTPMHRSRIAGLWPEARALARKMKRDLERDLSRV